MINHNKPTILTAKITVEYLYEMTKSMDRERMTIDLANDLDESDISLLTHEELKYIDCFIVTVQKLLNQIIDTKYDVEQKLNY